MLAGRADQLQQVAIAIHQDRLVAALKDVADPPVATIRARVKIRYRTPGRDAAITPGADATAAVGFDAPVDAVTPGQGAVFYDGDRVLGSGWIADRDTGKSR